MKKRLIKRGFLGVPIGIAVGFVITVIISICIGEGFFYPITLELITKIGNELNAVILQTVLCGIIGSTFAMASVIWEIDSWSLTKQSGIYFTISCVIMFPIAYISHWMKHSIGGGLSYIGIFTVIVIFVWLIQYVSWENKIQKMNNAVKNSNNVK